MGRLERLKAAIRLHAADINPADQLEGVEKMLNRDADRCEQCGHTLQPDEPRCPNCGERRAP